MLLVSAWTQPTLAQGVTVAQQPDLRWLWSARPPAIAIAVQPEARPPGLAVPGDDAPPANHEHRPTPSFATAEHELQPPGYFSIENPCAPENLNRNDEPLSQRTNCQALGIPSDWFRLPGAADSLHPR